MHYQLVRRAVYVVVLLTGFFSLRSELSAQAPPSGNALLAVGEVMLYRRNALGDSLPFDACSVYERTGRPEALLSGIRPGLRTLLDRPIDHPCAVPKPSEGQRSERLVRVDTVQIAGSTAEVHVHVRRDGWRHGEVYYFTSRADGGWALREVRMTPALHTTPPPPSR